MAEPPLHLVQLSDCHLLATPHGLLRGFDTEASLLAVLAELKARAVQQPLDGLLLTGDLAEDGSLAAYRRLLTYLEPFSGNKYFLPGNHDCPQTLQQALQEMGWAHPAQVALGAWRLNLLNSWLPQQVAGSVSDAQLAQLAQQLQVEAHHLVALHQHPLPMQSAWMDELALQQPEGLWQVLRQSSQVKAVVWGHVHQAYEVVHHDIWALACPATCMQFKPQQATFALDERRGPGYRQLWLYPDGRVETQVRWLAPGALYA